VVTLARANRLYGNRRGSSARFDDAEDDPIIADTSPVAVLQGASIYSSHEQSSF
jgi:hypothetical protein